MNQAEAAKGRTLLSLEDVDVTLGGRQVLAGVSLAVAGGEIVTLIGPNGAGKTTLLRVALGLLRPDRGTVLLEPGLRIGYMPQRLAIDPALPLSVRRFLSLGGAADGARLAAALGRVGAARTLDTPLRSVSGGEFQRVLLARALLRAPELLVLDEPSQGIDLAGQADLAALITGIRDEHGCGVLMVSHDLHLVMSSTNRVVCLDRAVCCTGAPLAVSGDPAYQRLFPGSAPGLALYEHQHDQPRVRDGACAPGGHGGRDGG